MPARVYEYKKDQTDDKQRLPIADDVILTKKKQFAKE